MIIFENGTNFKYDLVDNHQESNNLVKKTMRNEQVITIINNYVSVSTCER